MKKLTYISKLLIFLTLFFHCSVIYAKTKSIGSFKAWKAYTSMIEKNKTCFIASEPNKSTGKYERKNRGKTYVFVTNVKGSTNHEVSVVAGFNYKKNSEVIFTIDGQKTKMFPVEDRAWSESSKIDRSLARLMKKGKELTVTGISSPGNFIKDYFSLSGFTKALALIDKSCS